MNPAGPRAASLRTVVPLVLALALAAPARPQAARDREASVVDELVVTARQSGPAWWRVTGAGGAVVYVLGAPEALPKGLKWDEALTRRRLAGARELIGPPDVTAGLGDLFTLLKLRREFRSKGPMENGLAAPLRERFLADRRQLTGDTRAYSGWTPFIAALLMVQDFRHKAGLDPRQPAAEVEHLARTMNVRVVPAGTWRAVPLMRAVRGSLATEGPACLADALDEIEGGPARTRAAAEGWARGDVRAALSAQRGYEKCLASLPQGADVVDRSMTDTTAAIVAALRSGGSSVAVVSLRGLLARDGVLERLKGQGFAVEATNG
jgi:hypothetical protein